MSKVISGKYQGEDNLRDAKRFQSHAEKITLTFEIAKKPLVVHGKFEDVSLTGFCATIITDYPADALVGEECVLKSGNISSEAIVVRSEWLQQNEYKVGCKLKNEKVCYSQYVMKTERKLLNQKAGRLATKIF